MADLKYAWNSGDNSVQMSPDVSLPQFNVLGHRQRLIEVKNLIRTVMVDVPSLLTLCSIFCVMFHVILMNCVNKQDQTI